MEIKNIKNTPTSSSPSPKKKNVVKIVGRVINTILIIFIAFIAIIEIVGLASKGSNYGVPTFFGFQVENVVTDSMAKDEKGNTLYPVGTALVSKKEDFNSIKVNDNVVFYGYALQPFTSNVYQATVVHKVIDFGEINGNKYLVVRGANTYDHPDKYQVQYVFASETNNPVIDDFKNRSASYTYTGKDFKDETKSVNYSVTMAGVYMSKVVGASGFIGGLLNTLSSPTGLLLLILIPALIIIITSVVDIIKIKKTPEEEVGSKTKSEKVDSSDPLEGLSEEEKEKLKQEMIQEMLNEKNKGGDNK